MSTVEAAVAAHQSRNRALLESLAEKGADPFERRQIDLHFRVNGTVQAGHLGEALRGHGFSEVVVHQPSESGGKCSVQAQFQGSIVEATAVGFVERYVRLAEQHSAEFDGWGTSV